MRILSGTKRRYNRPVAGGVSGAAAGGIMRSSVKSALLRLLRLRAIGQPAAAIANRLRARTLSRKISGLSGYVPRVVSVALPDRLGAGKEFRMYGRRGRDAVARTLWFSGWGGFEPPMPDLFAALATDARWVLDVGSFSGFYTLVSVTVSPTARVLAFDPFPEAQQLFEDNLALNRVDERARLLKTAASDKPGTAPLYIPPTTTGLVEMASSLGSWHRPQHEQVLHVAVTTLDEAAARNNAGPVDLIKLDVESMEAPVLRGAATILREQRPVVFLEVLEGYDDGTLDAVAADFDYRCGVLTDTGLLWPDRIKAHPQFTNQVFCPREKVDSVTRTAAEACKSPAQIAR